MMEHLLTTHAFVYPQNLQFLFKNLRAQSNQDLLQLHQDDNIERIGAHAMTEQCVCLHCSSSRFGITYRIIPMDLRSSSTDKKIHCRLCTRQYEKYFEIFGEQGTAWKIASIVSTHFRFDLRKGDEHVHICHTCWWRIESFHVYYLEIQEAQKFFESLDECKVKTESTDFESTKYNLDDNASSSKINGGRIDFTKDEKCVDSQDGLADDNVQFDSDVVQQDDDQAMNVNPTDSECDLGYEAGTSNPQPSTNTNRSKRKRDHPLVLADDELIRNWCQMQCTQCSESFNGFRFNDVKSHYREQHDMNGFLKCCHKKFFRRIRALEHIARHMNPKEFSCEQCNKNFSDKMSLRSHMDGHVAPSQRPYKCNKCDQSFVRQYQLTQHQRHRHYSEEKKFICDICSKSFITKSILQSHIRSVHTNNTVSMCDVCAKTFKSKQCLQQHLLQHKGLDTTRVQCTICLAWLKHRNSLRGHMARHLDAESEHICKECGKTAPSRGALRSHQKYVHLNTKVFPCTLCEKSFKKALTLKEHVASCHTGEVLYHCPCCTKTFNSSANLCSHKKRMHQKNVESVA